MAGTQQFATMSAAYPQIKGPSVRILLRDLYAFGACRGPVVAI